MLKKCSGPGSGSNWNAVAGFMLYKSLWKKIPWTKMVPGGMITFQSSGWFQFETVFRFFESPNPTLRKGKLFQKIISTDEKQKYFGFFGPVPKK